MEFRTIGLIGAMDEEVNLFAERMEKNSSIMKAGITFRQGEWNGKRVILCKSGVGKVNAAVCTQILADSFGVEAVIFTGVAGALDPKLMIGDIVISVDCMQHDMDASALGFAKGMIPYADHSIFQADERLVQAAQIAGEALYPGKIHLGRILSGDQFVASREKVSELHAEMGGMCAEMEGAAVAQVCALNRIPFVVIRSMSDKADGTAQVDFLEFTAMAAERSAGIVERMLSSEMK